MVAQGSSLVLPVMVGDPDTALAALTLSGNSNNPFVLTPADFSFAGVGATRQLTITPQPGLPAPMEVVVQVSDGVDVDFTSFTLTVTPPAGTDPAVIPTAPGYYTRTFVDQGRVRNYLLLIPSGYDGLTPTPLVLAYHGGGQSMIDFGHKRVDLGAKCDLEGVILVFPDGTSHNNSKGFVGSPNDPRTVDDIAFTKALVTEFETTLNIDRDRLYGCGFSGGAKFVHWMVENDPCYWAAAAAVAGVISDIDFDTGLMTLPPPLEEPVPMLLVNGRLDTAKPWDGGVNTEGTPVSSVQDAVDHFLAALNCTGSPTVTPTPLGQGSVSVWDQCDQGAVLQLVDLSLMYHTWPDAADNLDYDANTGVIDFLLPHMRVCRPWVELQRQGAGQLELSWEGTLQFSPDVDTAFEDLDPQPAQPWVLDATQPKGFFRSRE